jgi:hypothetical protein
MADPVDCDPIILQGFFEEIVTWPRKQAAIAPTSFARL